MRAAVVGALMLVIGSVATLARLQAQTQPAIKPPTTRVMNCTAGGCHTSQTSHKFLHGPNAVHACDACHEHADPAMHTFQLKRQGRQLCDFCHIDKTGTEGPVVHKPVATGECLGCHDPHGANTRRMLKKDTTPELCATCHKDINTGKHVHKPASEDCAQCHKPHTSNHEKLLTMDRRELCLSCHADVGKTIAGAKHPHDPTKGDCLQCHKPHASNEIKALKASPKDLCATCHQKVVDGASRSTHPHSAVMDGRACLNCHTAHGSEHVKQLTKDPVGACLECHKNPVAAGKDRMIAAVPELGVDTLHRHGPIDKGDCAGCHDVHGGQRDKLLVGNYTTAFYQPYTDSAYELCLKCHQKELLLSQPARAETRFRDGERNLHTVHVSGGAQGRSCRACHTVHASKFEAQISDAVQFGQWKLPINFTPTMTGGSCAPGCHRAEKYDRGPAGARPGRSLLPAMPPAPKPPAGASPAPGTPQ